MNNQEVLFRWNYFCSLCDMLKNTTQFVDHSNPNNKMVNSFEFQKIIMLASMEFENIGKKLCVIANPKLNIDSSSFNIIKITKNILENYNELNKTTIRNDYEVFSPLVDWKIELNNDNKEVCTGIEWWSAYNHIKHNAFDYYKEATLKNAVDSLASLMILEINYVRIITGNSHLMNDKPCSYFVNPYQGNIIFFQ